MADIAAVQPVAPPEAAEDVEPRSYWSTVAGRVRRDRVTLTAGTILLLIVLLAVFAPWAAIYDPLQGDILHRLEPVGTPVTSSAPTKPAGTSGRGWSMAGACR